MRRYSKHVLRKHVKWLRLTQTQTKQLQEEHLVARITALLDQINEGMQRKAFRQRLAGIPETSMFFGNLMVNASLVRLRDGNRCSIGSHFSLTKVRIALPRSHQARL